MPPKKAPKDIDEYKTKGRVGEYDPEEFEGKNYEAGYDVHNRNGWINFARDFAEEHGITLGCAIRDKRCRLEYNTKYKVKHSIKNVPIQLQAWVRHSKNVAKKEHLTTSCAFNNKSNQASYHSGQLAEAPRKTPAKTLSVAELEQKLDRLIEEYKEVESGRAVGNLKSIDANIIRTRILLDERENEFLKNPSGLEPDDDDPLNEGRYFSYKQTKYDRPTVELNILKKNLELMKEELQQTADAYRSYKRRKGEDARPMTLYKLASHATDLKKQIKQVTKTIKSNDTNIDMVRKAKQGGSLMTLETARLGKPEKIQERDLRSASQIPTPSQNYNQPFGGSMCCAPKRKGKLSGYGRISDRRNIGLFQNDACLIPM